MPDLFHNPYHFVPLANGAPPETVPLTEFKTAAQARAHPHLTHDRFVAGTHSGRIVCRVTVETPLLCGNAQTDREAQQWTKLIQPFELTAGTPALPASALRGMLSSIAEAASHSALRVLKDTPLSHRAEAKKESLSALGLLVEEAGADGVARLKLRPLTVPTLPRQGSAGPLPDGYEQMFKPTFPQPLLKAFIEGYQPGRRNGQPAVEMRRGLFLDRVGPFSQSADHSEFWYAQLAGTCSLAGGRVNATQPRFDTRSGNWLLGQQIVGDPIPEDQYDPARHVGYTRGLLRVLGIRDREIEIPTGKKHEFFIPYPAAAETIPTFDAQAAVDRFHALADERTADDSTLPFSVAGSRRNGDARALGDKLRLRAGDLVFFAPDKDDRLIVGEVSVSSIWRAGNGSVHEYFATVSPDLLPLSHRRTVLTLAEHLFGVVEDRTHAPDRGNANRKPAFALASRVRVAHGELAETPAEGAYQPADELLSDAQRQGFERLRAEALRRNEPRPEDYPLKNLASPKPPSPALYFGPKDAREGGPISKSELQPDTGRANGRKFYLRRPNDSTVRDERAFVHPGNLDDRKRIARQHQSARKFVRPGTVFYFHLDFDNLTDLELQLLCFALAPDADFRHQLGHGKPLGFGQVKLGIEGLLLIRREARYRADALAADAVRYHEAWIVNADAWPARYRLHPWAAPGNLAEKLRALQIDFAQWAKRRGLDATLAALKLIGRPDALRRDAHGEPLPVHYPQTPGTTPRDARFERELFKWFMDNDDRDNRPQFLPPLTAGNTDNFKTLPALDRAATPDPNGGQRRGGQFAPGPRGGGGGPRRAPTPPPAPRPAPPAAMPTRPEPGRTYEFDAAAHERDGRVRFQTTLAGRRWEKCYLDVQKFDRSKWRSRFPIGTRVSLVVRAVQGDTLQLAAPAQ